jgi:hypothetical protein
MHVKGNSMPQKRTLERARRKARQGKSASTVAGEFVREELEEIRAGKHGARSAKQAIAIGLSKARRAGVPLAGKGKRTKKRPSASHIHGRYVSKKRSRASTRALRHEPRRAASHRALSRQAHRVAKLSERGRTTSQSVAKRRARSLKRETGGGKDAKQASPGLRRRHR